MTALGKLFRTTVFKLSLVYLLVFAIGSGAVIGWVAWSVRRLVDEQIAAAIEAEINGLSEQYAQAGIRRLVFIIDRRTRRPGSSLYLVTNYRGDKITGNISALPPGTLDRAGVTETRYQRLHEQEMSRKAMARIFILRGGFRLLVGRDLGDRETLREVMSRALITSLLWLIAIGTLGGLFVARRVLRRVDAMNASAQNIMAGDLTGRLPVAGSNDELDRLAINLNTMLDRINELLAGLREVSDNIAHDLKTPLTRLRNRTEEALRNARNADEYRDALEKVIDESDNLIRIFNALLMIARVEAGAQRESMRMFDLSEVVQDVAELYEPVAEEAGAALKTDVTPGLRIRGNRELVGQALANLIDNAIKYGARHETGNRELAHAGEPAVPASGLPAIAAQPVIRVSAQRSGSSISIKVSDNGPGIPPEEHARVLDRFVRLEGSRSRPGSGLGLSLVAAVARLHDGVLDFSDAGPGLLATLTLPAATAAIEGVLPSQ